MHNELIMSAQPVVATVADLTMAYKSSAFDLIDDFSFETKDTVKNVVAAAALIALLIGWWSNGRTIGGFIAAFCVAALVIWGVNNVEWGKDTVDETITQSETGKG